MNESETTINQSSHKHVFKVNQFGAVLLFFKKITGRRRGHQRQQQDNTNASPIALKEVDTKHEFDFSQRQLDIIALAKQGKTNRQIGEILFISENTVKYHLKIIYSTLKIENRIGLAYVNL